MLFRSVDDVLGVALDEELLAGEPGGLGGPQELQDGLENYIRRVLRGGC